MWEAGSRGKKEEEKEREIALDSWRNFNWTDMSHSVSGGHWSSMQRQGHRQGASRGSVGQDGEKPQLVGSGQRQDSIDVFVSKDLPKLSYLRLKDKKEEE